jgi:hypothetical protein
MKQNNQEIEDYRVREGRFASTPSYGNNGVFILPHPFIRGWTLRCIVSDGEGWEHVSVSLVPAAHVRSYKPRVPNWQEMSHVKDMFWDTEETVVQY